MNFIKSFGLACLSLAIVGCQNQSSIIEVADNYLQAVQSQDSQAFRQYRCLKDLLDSKNPSIDIAGWEIIGYAEKPDENDPDSSYYSVNAKITSISNGIEVENTWVIAVWESEELLQHQKRIIVEVYQHIDKMNKLLGKEPKNPPEELIPKRSDITDEKYCVTNMSRL